MKSEPDRLDLLIVLLPLALVVVLGVQAYHFFQSREGRAAGAELALQVEELAATKVEIGAPKEAAAPGNASTPSNTVEPPATNEEADLAAAAAAAPALNQAPAPMEADAAGGSGGPAPPTPEARTQAAPPPAPQPRPESSFPAPAAGGEAGGTSGAAAAPAGKGGPAATGGTIVGGIAPGGAAPPSTPGDEPPTANSRGNNRQSIAPDPEPPERSAPRQPARVTATPQPAEVGVGQLIPVEIRIASGTNVASVPFHLKFDPKVLKLNGSPRSERGPFLTQDGSDPQFLVATGPAGDEVIIGLSLLGAAAGASGEGVLCTIYFLAVAPGTSSLQFTHASVRGPDARMLPATFLPSAIKVNG